MIRVILGGAGLALIVFVLGQLFPELFFPANEKFYVRAHVKNLTVLERCSDGDTFVVRGRRFAVGDSVFSVKLNLGIVKTIELYRLENL